MDFLFGILLLWWVFIDSTYTDLVNILFSWECLEPLSMNGKAFLRVFHAHLYYENPKPKKQNKKPKCWNLFITMYLDFPFGRDDHVENHMEAEFCQDKPISVLFQVKVQRCLYNFWCYVLSLVTRKNAEFFILGLTPATLMINHLFFPQRSPSICSQHCTAPGCFGSYRANRRQSTSLKGASERSLDRQSDKPHPHETARKPKHGQET